MKVLVDDVYIFDAGNEPRDGFRRGYYSREDCNDVCAVDFMIIEDFEIEAIYPGDGYFDVKIKNIKKPFTCHYNLITLSDFTKRYGDFIRSHPSVEIKQEVLKKLWMADKVEWPKTRDEFADKWNKFLNGLKFEPINETLFTELAKNTLLSLYNELLCLKIRVPYYDNDGRLQHWNPSLKPLNLKIRCAKPLIKFNEYGGFKCSFDEGQTWKYEDKFCYDSAELCKVKSTICLHLNEDAKFFLYYLLGFNNQDNNNDYVFV